MPRPSRQQSKVARLVFIGIDQQISAPERKRAELPSQLSGRTNVASKLLSIARNPPEVLLS